MAYTTAAKVKDGLAYQYWKLIQDRLDEDGYDYTSSVFTDEETFLEKFIDEEASFIDDYVGGGPFEANGTLERINKWLAIYSIEQYILGGTQDRVISVSINEDKKRAIQLLDKIVAGDIFVTVEGGSSSDTLGLIESDDDGVTLVIGDLEENILMGGDADDTTIPELGG